MPNTREDLLEAVEAAISFGSEALEELRQAHADIKAGKSIALGGNAIENAARRAMVARYLATRDRYERAEAGQG